MFKVGQQLTVNILQTQGQNVQLTLGNQTYVAHAKEPITQTGTLQVQVKQTQPTLELVILNPNKTTSTSNPTPQNSQTLQTLQLAYRQFYPNQTAITQVFQQLSLLPTLPSALQGTINQLMDSMLKPQSQTLSTKELQQKLADSGLFLESKLAQPSKGSPQTDIKALLLKLQQQTLNEQNLKPTSALTQLSSTLTQAINRLTVQQLQMIENPNIIPFELPVESHKTVEKISLEFRHNTQNSESIWEVYMDLTLPNGQLSTKITLQSTQGAQEVNCYLWCETPQLQQQISDNLTKLQQQFSDNQLNLRNLQIIPIKPSKSVASTKIALIDIHI
ncbi:hypothetical protein [Thiomicrorhabdus aquaedulcis]|uniref:hypothetical protein n=1 Tax=Thiomicrorhabdus aquaedulcis TaxID=2211106 RepID=UPI000FDC14D5|nr:hypothetical protein [Thiomicrorhabdus aquaedulcis]